MVLTVRHPCSLVSSPPWHSKRRRTTTWADFSLERIVEVNLDRLIPPFFISLLVKLVCVTGTNFVYLVGQ